jgi:hypothetical protein
LIAGKRLLPLSKRRNGFVICGYFNGKCGQNLGKSVSLDTPIESLLLIYSKEVINRRLDRLDGELLFETIPNGKQ